MAGSHLITGVEPWVWLLDILMLLKHLMLEIGVVLRHVLLLLLLLCHEVRVVQLVSVRIRVQNICHLCISRLDK